VNDLPRVFIGSSPFIGAGQFGFRALEYYRKFYLQPRNIVKVVSAAYKLGVKGFQLLPFKPLVEATKKLKLRNECPEHVVGTVGCNDYKSEIGVLKGLEAKACLVHASITDSLKATRILEVYDAVREEGMSYGLVTHRPGRLLEWLMKSKLECLILLLSLNKIGYMADMPFRRIAELISMFKGVVLAKKVLAAGRLKPKEALNFISHVDKVYGVVIGASSESEVKETFRIALSIYEGHSVESAPA